jgi:hypothetical protein
VLGTAHDGPFVDLVLRWLAGQLLAPQPAELRRATADLLAAASSSASAFEPATAGT